MRYVILIFSLVLIGLSQTACSTFKSDEAYRKEYSEKESLRRSKLSAEQLKYEDDRRVAMNDCVARSNAYGGSTPQGHMAVYNACMHQKGY